MKDAEKLLALELSGMNKAYEGEISQRKFKIDLKPPEEKCSGIEEDYFSLFQEETRYIGYIQVYLINEELKYYKMKTLEKVKAEELENESSRITEDWMDQVQHRGMKRRIEQRMGKVLEEVKLI
ncbi:hypothetical protein O181_068630 [Austropuccinia psidii MF-1]|uniref:Uncharacterized protein n=1 Tax=Austropuccinia psidii MF-1 TaxID=1389203 RepID=A0A9Q3ESW8_9BASI|nr:hypothetical protein [Austropuccinia psidii MF-1]